MASLESSGLLESKATDLEGPCDNPLLPEVQQSTAETVDADDQPEQKVLGYLAESPSWSKVLDMGGGGIYYWHLTTNEVVWEVPEGCDPEKLLPPETERSGDGAGDGDGKCAEDEKGAGALGPAVELSNDPQLDVGSNSGRSLGAVKQSTSVEVPSAAPAIISGGINTAPEVPSDDLEEGQLPEEGDRSLNTELGQSPSPDSDVGNKTTAIANPSASTSQSIARPQAHVTAVLESLESEAREAAAGFLTSLPAVVR